ncbi:hypothetical protein EMIHUDRAFT_458322 [Emiliania huxleyi CCMP1516]|uniref:Uncharacterized protein n=2 Tax=Emiliania huxleyi TaxID=2903 RepID=A0A0D3JDH1_EMIH1|nr:hypothetical protein EMIHUDRAFT_458322 [Emiliania huxleyi CCMP1516]EOD21556.1 hypothetical protein EMIHUDRAFT_458322 [Emiliania huxleyi CCMP1516]|eukprot:XP_005773985.1 hypothetical protein EMIHUDRAFT_458322 [Emiliania huxleyi CCMP1516]
MHAALDTTCTEQPTLDTYAQSHGQAFLNGELLAGILNASLEMPRQTLSGGIPNGAAEAGLEAAGVSGWQASLAKSVLLPVVRPYLGDGIDNIAVEGFECKDFVMREVETEYCLPFRIGGQVTGLNVVCSGEYVLDLSWPVQPVEGLLDEQSQQLRGGFRLQLEPESSLLLTKLDLQRDEIFTAFSRCDFHLVPRVTMDFRGLRFAPDGVRPRTASELAIFRAAGVEGTPDEEGLISCATGHSAGADSIYALLDRVHQQTFGIVPAEAFQCPDVPKFLCDSVVRPQLNGQVENVWGLLHQTTSLSGPILRYIFVLAALTAMTAAVLLVPKIETLLKHARDQLASMDDDDDIDSLLEQFLRAVSSGGAATRRFSAHFDGDGDGVADAGSSVVDRAAFAGARGLGKVGSLAERTVLPLFAWLVNKTAHGATWLATCVACLLIFAASTLLLFAVFVAGFVLFTLVNSSHWCSDHSPVTALPEGALAGLAFLVALYLLLCQPRMPHGVKHALVLYLGCVCTACGLRALTRSLLSDDQWYYLVLMRYADLCYAGALLAVYYLSLSLPSPGGSPDGVPPFVLPYGGARLSGPRGSRAAAAGEAGGAAGATVARSLGLREAGRQVCGCVGAARAWLAGARSRSIRRLGGCCGASVVPARLASFWRSLGMDTALHLRVIDVVFALGVYCLLCSLNDWIITVLMALLAAYAWLLLLLECDLLLRSRGDEDIGWVELVDGERPSAARVAQAAANGGAVAMAKDMYLDGLLDTEAWARDVKAKFVGGGSAVRAVRCFWWACLLSLCSLATTSALEPVCNDLPCLQHTSSCPLPYPFNHRSLGYTIDLAALICLVAGAFAEAAGGDGPASAAPPRSEPEAGPSETAVGAPSPLKKCIARAPLPLLWLLRPREEQQEETIDLPPPRASRSSSSMRDLY